jgi:hypothetical protein
MLFIVALLLGLAVGYGGVRIFWGYPPAPEFRRLSRREVAFLRAAGDAMFPPGGAIPPSGSDAGVPEYVDDYLGVVPVRMRVLMRLLFFLVEHATIVLPARGPSGFRRFSSLSDAQRIDVLQGWRSSGLVARRIVFTSLRAILTNCYVSDPAVLRHLELAPFAIEPPICEADLLYPRIGAHPSTIAGQVVTAPSRGTPLRLDAPLHPSYREGASGEPERE